VKLVVHTFTTLDGVMQAPGGVEEDASGAFAHGGWIVPFADADMGTVVEGWFAEADEILLGRRTYELMQGYWSEVTDPANGVARQLNGRPKHVVSTSLGTAAWSNSAIVSGDLGENVAALKAKPGGELQVHGSWQLVQSLNALRLVDEYRLITFPVVVGEGKRLFHDGTPPTGFEVLELRSLGSGAAHVRLRPLGAPRFGDVHVEDGAESTTLR
jgi:dihydrofolate reductase